MNQSNNDSAPRVALITGAAGALGEALIQGLLARGLDCVAVDRNRRALERLHDRIEASGDYGRPPLVVPLDLAGAGPQHFAELAGALEQQFGRLDLLIHAAADFKALTPLEHHDPEDWMKVLQAGLTGPFLLSQALLPLLRATPDSRMIWISDDPAGKRKAYWGAYGVAQAGREALAAILAAERGDEPPTAEVIDPGPFHSPLRARAWPAEHPDSQPSAAQAAEGVLARLLD